MFPTSLFPMADEVVPVGSDAQLIVAALASTAISFSV